jgi:hypothetical protein
MKHKPKAVAPQDAILTQGERDKSNISKKIASLLLSSSRSDVTFLVGEEPEVQSFPAHQLILSLSSPVFDAMFKWQLTFDKIEIRMNDEDPEAFKAVLRYLYTDEPQLNDEIVMWTLYFAKKYMLDHLEDKCSAFVIKNLNLTNVIRFYQQVSLFKTEFCELFF